MDLVNRCRAYALVAAVVSLAGCAATRGESPTKTLVQPAIDPTIETFLQEMVTEEHFSGVVLVMQDSRVRHAGGYGPASEGRANDVTTAFHVASLTKQFTAAAILQLVEKGTIELHQSINRRLPARYRSPRWEKVTVHHLLSHSSGIEDYAVTRDYYELVDGFTSEQTIDGMIEEAMAKDLQFEPGSQFAYSNMNYVLLGKIIEHKTHLSYADYTKRNILQPMFMQCSEIWTEGHIPAKNEATGLRWSEDQGRFVKDNLETLPGTPADAGLITTLGDFAKWAQIFSGGDQEIVSQKSIDAMTSQQTQMGVGGSVHAYGYGLGVGDRLLVHTGHVLGFSSQFVLDRQANSLIVVFSNNSAVNLERVVNGLLTLVLSAAA